MAAPALQTITETTVNVADTSTTVISANTDRQFIAIQNVSDTDIWISLLGTAVVNAGLCIAPWCIYEFSISAGNLWQGSICAIHADSGTTKRINVVEGE